MSQRSKKRTIFNKNRKRQNVRDDNEEREPKNPRIEISNDDDSSMVIDTETTLLLSSTPSPSPLSYVQDDNEMSSDLNRMSLDNTDCCDKLGFKPNFIKEAICIAQSFEDFAPLISAFLTLGKDIIILYEKAEHHKELCSFLLQRCNCAVAAVQDLDIRKTENTKFFSKNGNLNLFKEFIKCIKKIRNFIEEISQLSKIRRYIFTNNIEDTFSKLVTEFDGYMNSLNFSFTIQAIDEFKIIKDETRQIKELLLNVYGVSDDKQSQQNFLRVCFLDRPNPLHQPN